MGTFIIHVGILGTIEGYIAIYIDICRIDELFDPNSKSGYSRPAGKYDI